MIWSDPIDDFDETKSEQAVNHDSFVYNFNRGCSFNFTFRALEKFLKKNNLICLIRAHQVQKEGIYLARPLSKHSEFPCMISVFSAPNYCDVYGNKGALLRYDGCQLHVKLFTAAAHPFVLPNFQNALTWSLPFIIEKLNDILVYFLNLISDEETAYEEDEDIKFKRRNERVKIFDKINVIKKCHEIYKKSNELKGSDLQLGPLTPTNQVRRRSSEINREMLINLQKRGVRSFEDATNLDTLQYKIVNSEEND